MKRSWVWIALLLSVGINVGILATIATARYRGGPRVDRSPSESAPPFARMADHLGLEGEVKEQFLAIQEDLFRTTRQQRERLEALRGEMRQEIIADIPDPVRVDQLLAETAEVSRDLDAAMVESVLATRRLLSPEQQQRYFRVLDRLRPGGRQFGHRDRPPHGRRRAPDLPPPVKEEK
jgi:Spy/CpxP family protein refolding chaperone